MSLARSAESAREGKGEIDTDRQTDEERQTDRQTDGERQTDRQREEDTKRETERTMLKMSSRTNFIIREFGLGHHIDTRVVHSSPVCLLQSTGRSV